VRAPSLLLTKGGAEEPAALDEWLVKLRMTVTKLDLNR
jgi:hypothetical protein